MRGTAKSDYELLQDEMRQIKRENAALRSDLSKCNNLSEIRRDAFYDEKSARWAMVDRMRELERENATLRSALTTLLAWEDKGGDIPPTAARGLFRIARAAIDAARKANDE